MKQMIKRLVEGIKARERERKRESTTKHQTQQVEREYVWEEEKGRIQLWYIFQSLSTMDCFFGYTKVFAVDWKIDELALLSECHRCPRAILLSSISNTFGPDDECRCISYWEAAKPSPGDHTAFLRWNCRLFLNIWKENLYAYKSTLYINLETNDIKQAFGKHV